jgi:subtilisin family serine protease
MNSLFRIVCSDIPYLGKTAQAFVTIACAVLAIVCVPFPAHGSVALRKSLAVMAAQDTLCRTWVIFADKNSSNGVGSVSPRAEARRIKAGARSATNADAPVSRSYIKQVEDLGCRCVNIFKWANAASFIIPSRKLYECAKLACVKDMLPVRKSFTSNPSRQQGGLKKRAAGPPDSSYGAAYAQVAMLAVPPAHQWLNERGSQPPGTGLVIGFFDSGFRLKHNCFSYLIAHNLVLADSDFIDHDNTVYDPDSVVNDPQNPYYHNDEHGSMTLSLVAGYDPPKFLGVAWGARFILARTEDSPVEKHYEEDNWAAAMVWAESLGVDIVSSSLGYSNGFTPPDTDYTYADMNGKTTIVSKAAEQAALNGVLVVNSMGNDGPDFGTISAPADAADVVAVGAVDASENIAFFSSRGPTSDGRTKPDCVALGLDAAVPQIYGPGSDTGYTLDDGTSFSTPLVAGVTALILQAHSGDSAESIRNRLYASCFFAPGQSADDNTFGRGAPDALLGVLPDSQTYLTTVDSFGNAVAGATVRTSAGALAGTSDSRGYAIVTISKQLPETLFVTHPSYLTTSAIVPFRHSRLRVVVPGQYVLRVVVRDATDSAIVAARVFWRNAGDPAFVSQQTDSTGVALLSTADSSHVELYAVATGYFTSSRTTVALTVGITNRDTLRLKPRAPSQFVLYPNVINIGSRHQRLTLEFTAGQDSSASGFTAAIRSIDGALVWHYSLQIATGGPVQLRWPDPGVSAAPGVYFFIINYGDKTYKQKFLVTG